MKKRTSATLLILSLWALTILYSCAEEKNSYNPKNHFKKLSKVETQTYTLDTSRFVIVTGELGTTILFERDDFEVAKSDSITLKLEEYYTFEDLLFNGIQTVTDKNELLESSGVIRLNFYANGKEIHLKEGRSIEVRFPDQRLKNNQLFNGKKDSLNQFTWTLAQQNDTIITVNKGTKWQPVIVDLILPKDSVSEYFERERVRAEAYKRFSSAILSKLNWINIDRVVQEDRLLSLELQSNIEDIQYYTLYVVYENMNSFLTYYKSSDESNFKDIKIKGNTYLIALTEAEDGFYADRILLSNLEDKTKVQLDLKEMSLEECAKLFLFD